MEKGLVTIITPCYNAASSIEETMKSVLNQSYTHFEYFVVDDGSSDESVEIIRSIEDERIKLLVLPENKGVTYARNVGISKAKGEFLSFVDSDDVWMPDFLKTSINFLESNNAPFVYTSYERADEQLNIILKPFIADDYVDYNRMLYNCPVLISTITMRRAVLGDIFIPDVDKREDHAYYLEILKRIPHLRAIQKPQVIYRIRSNSYSRNKFEIMQKQFMVYKKFLGFSWLKSFYYTIHWAWNGWNKYRN